MRSGENNTWGSSLLSPGRSKKNRSPTSKRQDRPHDTRQSRLGTDVSATQLLVLRARWSAAVLGRGRDAEESTLPTIRVRVSLIAPAAAELQEAERMRRVRRAGRGRGEGLIGCIVDVLVCR